MPVKNLPSNTAAGCTNTASQWISSGKVRGQHSWSEKCYETATNPNTKGLCKYKLPIFLTETLHHDSKHDHERACSDNISIKTGIVQWAGQSGGEENKKTLDGANDGCFGWIISKFGLVVCLKNTETSNNS